MRKKEPYIFIVPSKAKEHLLKCIEMNKPEFDFEIDYFFWIINLIISFSSLNKRNEKKDDFVSISSKYVEKYIKGGVYSYYFKYLLSIELLECDEKYDTLLGISKGYKIKNEFIENFEIEKSYFNVESTSKLWKSISLAKRKNTSHQAILPYIKTMKKYFHETKFDFEGARNYILEMNISGKKNKEKKRLIYLDSIYRLQDKRLRNFEVSKSNWRLHSNYTNLLKELRTFIIGDKVNIDLSNSQPFFLSQILRNAYTSNESLYCSQNNKFYSSKHPIFKGVEYKIINAQYLCIVEITDFEKQCIEGNLYNFLALKFNETNEKKLKKTFLAMLYAENNMKCFNNYKYLFHKLYPSISEYIFDFKKEDYKKLSLLMQKMEADVFINGIGERMVKNNIEFITIHDSLIVNKEDQLKTLEIMKEVFNERFGVIPKFKIEEI